MKSLSTLFNGNNGNGNGKNGVSPGTDGTAALQQSSVLMPLPEAEPPAKPPTPVARPEAFDQPVILQQTSLWSRSIVWGIVGVTTFVVLWASIARIEEAVPAQGKLEPQGQVQNIQAPVGGVVQEILVKEGDRVTKGQVLIRFDPRAAQAQLQSLQAVLANLEQENRFYRSQFSGTGDVPLPEGLPPEILALTQNRAELIAENNVFRAQLFGDANVPLTAEQRLRLAIGQAETDSRVSAARLEVAQLEGQLHQAELQLEAAQQTLQINEGILQGVEPLMREGGLSRVQYQRQKQEVITRQAERDRLSQEILRLRAAIAQAQQRVINTQALGKQDLLNRYAENQKRLAEITSQLNKNIVENEKRIADLKSQLAQTQLTLSYQEVRANHDGVVFDLQAKGPGFVANTSEPILKVVPTDSLIAEVYITNQDIGFVQEGMEVDVRIDSFPFSEFGDVKGKVVRIGSDALPPDQIHQFWRFPAKVQLDAQTLSVEGRNIPLQSGMSVTGNIITRDRTIMSIFTDLFSRRIESLKTVR